MSADLQFTDKKQAVEQLEAWLKNLPSDTKSIQICAFAYNDSYDDWTEKKTKCRKEANIWWNLSPEDQSELLQEAVTATLQQVSELKSLPCDTEEDLLYLREHYVEPLRKDFRSLARSFNMCLGEDAKDNIDTAALAEEQLERLYSGILAFDDKEYYDWLMETFAKFPGMKKAIEKMQWSLMTRSSKPKVVPTQKAASKQPQVNKPIGKPNVPQKAAETKTEEKSQAPEKK